MTTALARPSAPEVHEIRVPGAHLHAFVAIDDTRLGPAFGGCRFRPYPDTEAAVADAQRLAAGMTLKNALAGIPFGGGKAVIMQPPGGFDRSALFEAFGAAVEQLGGRYVTAMDSGTETSDMDAIGRSTGYVSGRTGAEGDPSPYTALGVFRGIQTALASIGEQLQGRRIAIGGVGHVGAELARRLADAGAELLIADPVTARAEAIAKATDARILTPAALPAAVCDVFAPCGLGGVLDAALLPQLNCRIIAGAANNQLATPDIAAALAHRGLLYAPDFLINAGGVIHAALAWSGESSATISARVERIGDTLAEVLDQARAGGQLPVQVALELARVRIEAC